LIASPRSWWKYELGLPAFQLSGSRLGFSSRGCMPVFIALGLQREPLDQTDLKNGIDAILGGDGGTSWKLLMSEPRRGPGGMVVGLAGPTCHPLRVHCGVVSSGVL
jgi:hypothetical protein